MIYCRQCKQNREWKQFLDDEGRVSTRCEECRKAAADAAATTLRETPQSRKASGKVSAEEVRRLMQERETDPPPDEKLKK